MGKVANRQSLAFSNSMWNKWESAKVSHKRVFALLTPEIHSYEMAQMLQKPVFALPGCQRTSVNTLLCDTLALAEQMLHERTPIARSESQHNERRFSEDQSLRLGGGMTANER